MNRSIPWAALCSAAALLGCGSHEARPRHPEPSSRLEEPTNIAGGQSPAARTPPMQQPSAAPAEPQNASAASREGRTESPDPVAEHRPERPLDELGRSLAQVPGLVRLYQAEFLAELDERCGDFEVRTRATGEQTRVEIVDPAGKVVKSFTPAMETERYEPAWCFDVTGDGTPELAITKTTGGAHCCHEHTLLSLGTRVSTLLVHPAGSSSNDLLTPVALDPGARTQPRGHGAPPWELLDTNDVLVTEGSAPYAYTRLLPVVFRFEGGKYVPATRQFPDLLKTLREEALRELRQCVQDCWTGPEGEYVLGLSLLIGDWDTFKAAEACPPEAQQQLDELARRIAKGLL